MAIPTLTGLGPDPQFNDLVMKINSLVGELRNALLTLDTVNVIELNAEVITALSITADKIAALSITADKIAADAVTADKIDVNELSAISANMGTITAGTLNAVNMFGSVITGSLIQTQTSGNYPRIELSNTSNLLRAQSSSNNAIELSAGGFGNTSFVFTNSSVLGFMRALSDTLLIDTASGLGDIQISAGEDIRLVAAGDLFVPQWSDVINTSTSQSLQAALNEKMNLFFGLTTSKTVGSETWEFTNGVLTNIT